MHRVCGKGEWLQERQVRGKMSYRYLDRGLIGVPIARGEGKFVLLQIAF